MVGEAVAAEPIHLLASNLPSVVRCGQDPELVLMFQVTSLWLLVTCPDCRRVRKVEARRGCA